MIKQPIERIESQAVTLTPDEIATACGMSGSSLSLLIVRLVSAADPTQGVEVIFHEKTAP